jgi:hypothetical protein
MMGVNKQIFLRAIGVFLFRATNSSGFIKKLVVAGLLFGLVMIVGLGFMVYLALGFGKDLLAGSSDMDLLALERLVAEKNIVLNEAQQRSLTQVIEGLSTSSLASERVIFLKKQLFESITPDQLAKLEEWKTGLVVLPPAVAALIEQYTGLSQETVETHINSILVWLKGTGSGKDAGQLQKP